MMNRTGEPSVAELMAQLAVHAAEIVALKAEKEVLSQHLVKLEEELALARLYRLARRSEKHVDRIFNEAEQVADEDDADSEDNDVVDLPDTGLPSVKNTTGKKLAADRCRKTCHASASNMISPTIRRPVLAVVARCIAWGETVTEQLHIEVKAKVLQNVRFKYACRYCDRTGVNTPFVTAPMPTQPLPGRIASASARLQYVLTELPQRTKDADIDDLLRFNFPQTTAA